MIKADTATTKRMLSLHGWSAVVTGLLLYIVILTGTLAVFERELGVWATPLSEAPVSPLPEDLGERFLALTEQVNPDYLEEIAIFTSAGDQLAYFFHHHVVNPEGESVEHGSLILTDPVNSEIIEIREGESPGVFYDTASRALSDFLVMLHVQLLLPGNWGLFLTGILGFAMLIAAVSGLIIHRHMLKEVFTLRRREKDSLLEVRDKHATAASWNLPFALLLSFTGAFFSFGGAVGLPAIAWVAFSGDVEAVVDTLYDSGLEKDERSAEMQNLDGILADASTRDKGEPQRLFIQNWGRADAAVQITMATPEGKLLPSTLAYRLKDGEFLGARPVFGTEASLGGNLAGLMTPLHFGNFAGLASRLVWFALGFSAAWVSLTGMWLWLRRRQDEPGWRPLAAATTGIGYGLPLALLSTALLAIVARSLGTALLEAMHISFFLSIGFSIALAWRQNNSEKTRRTLLQLCSFTMLCLPLLRWVTGGLLWPEAAAGGVWEVIALDVVFLIAAVACYQSAVAGFTATKPSRTQNVLASAE